MQRLCSKLTAPLLSLAIGAAACSAARANELPTWREGVVPFKGDAGFFDMAKKKGFFRQHGVNVEFVQVPGNVKLVRDLLAGALDGIEASPGAMLKAIRHGADITFIGSTLPGLTYAFYANDSIKTWSDLKGKTIGASAPGSVADIFSRITLKNHGVDPSSVHIANAGGSSGTYIKALSEGEIAAASASTEFIPVAKKLHIKVMATSAQETPLYPRLVVASTTSILKKKGKDTVARFMAGYMEGLQYALAHRKDEIDLTAKLTHDPAARLTYAFLYDEVVKEGDASSTMAIPVDRIEWLENYMLQNNLLDKKIDINAHVDQSYRQEALKLLKK